MDAAFLFVLFRVLLFSYLLLVLMTLLLLLTIVVSEHMVTFLKHSLLDFQLITISPSSPFLVAALQ